MGSLRAHVDLLRVVLVFFFLLRLSHSPFLPLSCSILTIVICSYSTWRSVAVAGISEGKGLWEGWRVGGRR